MYGDYASGDAPSHLLCGSSPHGRALLGGSFEKQGYNCALGVGTPHPPQAVLTAVRSRFGSCVINAIHYRNAALLPFSHRRRLNVQRLCKRRLHKVRAILESPLRDLYRIVRVRRRCTKVLRGGARAAIMQAEIA